MNILITSGTGKVGTEVVRLLTALGHSSKIITRDLNKPETWDNYLEGIDKVCLITPPIQDEGPVAVNFAERAYARGVKQIVFLGIHNVEAAPHIPHFKAKIDVEEALVKSGKPYTIIEANNFYQNDMWFLPMAKETGMYLQPIGPLGLSRVDVRDIAECMVNALVDDRHHFKSYPLVGGEVLNGQKTANLISEVLGKKITYPENCMEIWEETLSKMIPHWLLEDWKIMYKFFNENGLKASPLDLIQQEKILGKAPRKYETYLKENA